MKTYQLFIILLVVSLFSVVIETTVISFPFVFLLCLAMSVFFRNTHVYIGAFILSLVIDAMRVSNFGITGLFIFGTLFLIHLYEKYFGSSDIVVSIFIVMAVGLIYTFFSNYSVELVTGFFVIGTFAWYFISRLIQKNSRVYYE